MRIIIYILIIQGNSIFDFPVNLVKQCSKQCDYDTKYRTHTNYSLDNKENPNKNVANGASKKIAEFRALI